SLMNFVDIPDGTVTVNVDHTDKFIFTAAFRPAVGTIHKIDSDGSILSPLTAITLNVDDRPHQLIVEPGNKFVYMPCMGIDEIKVYNFDETLGIANLETPLISTTPNGVGPRFLAFHTTKPFAYATFEFANEISAFNINPENGMLTEINTLSTLPEDYNDGGTAAQIHVTPNNQFVYIANRGYNSIAGYKINQETGALTLASITEYATDTRPRAFNFSPASDYVFVGGYDNGEVVTYAIDSITGDLTEKNNCCGGLLAGT
ncbi:MAG: beta-propeller fold lactonase family protein, partial [Flavobacteriales bacterium]|nr:beta-propeller fold lactonase family protein [Flavobacteriales bacterium]